MLPLAALITIVLIGIVALGLIVWDIIAATNKIPNSVDTISGRMRIWGKKTLLLPWTWAVLFGHFWGPKVHLMSHKVSIPILILITGLVVGAGVLLRGEGETVITSWPIFFVILNLGAIAGALLWPQ